MVFVDNQKLLCIYYEDISLIISFQSNFMIEGIAGLAVTYGLNLNMIQAWVIWNLCNLENKIISVERILQYTSIPSEPPLVVEENRPDPSWPSYGEVDIRDLQVVEDIILFDTIQAFKFMLWFCLLPFCHQLIYKTCAKVLFS